MEDFHHLKIQLEDIKSATDNFDSSKQIGRGAFGPVYKGELSFPEGRSMVAFKRLDIRYGQGHLEFMKEIMMLSKYKHENLVSLLRFSIEGDERILVYEYVARGSLDRYLSNTSLTWTQRLKICVGVARALNYLHDPKGTHERVIHRDIKSSNILLDEKWTAKVSDFGLSKLAPANQPQTYVLSNLAGTPGYCDPLYFETYFLTKESDVYSFGVVLFEVLCGRLCYEYGNGEFTHILVPMWKEYYEEKRLDEIICSGLKEQMTPGSLDMFSAIAYRCLNRDRKERPSMEKIVKELEITLEEQELFDIIIKKVDFEELVRIAELAVPPLSYTSQSRLAVLFGKGFFVDDSKTWLSINKNGNFVEMVSAIKCISGDKVEKSNDDVSRFSEVLIGVEDGFKVEVNTQFLSPHVTYTINLILKLILSLIHPTPYIPLRYKLDGETYYFNSCIAQKREDGWWMVELYQFTSCQKKHDFKIEFQTLDCLLEGIEFRPVENETRDDLEQPISNSDMDWEQILPTDYTDLIKLSKEGVRWTTKKELYHLLRKGFLIENGQQWFYVSKTMKKRLVIPARAFLKEEEWIWKSLSESRFEVVAESRDKHCFDVRFQIKSKVLSPNTEYSCHLIYKLPENYVLLDNLIAMEASHSHQEYFYLITPPHTPIIGHKVGIRKIKGHPKLRKDGWMEFQFMETSLDSAGFIDKITKFSFSYPYKGSFEGLVVQSIEFRPL